MTNARRYLFLSVLLCLGTTAAWASSVVVNTSLSTSVTISSSGTVVISLPVGVSTFAEALDTSGGFDASASNPANAADSTLADASGAGSATGTTLTGSVTANVNLPDNFNGEAYSEGDSDLSGTFEITGAPGSVNVTFSASPSVSQSLDTTGPGGQSAYSYAIFTFTVEGVNSSNPILAYVNEPSIGPGVSQIYGSPSPLTDTESLSANTVYYFDASLDAESDGVSIVPEPSSLSLVLTAFGLLAVLGRRLTRKLRPDGRG
jgi:hypothetical protein